ncbi:RNA dependent RNA polymerase P1 [Luteovirus sociomali]|nr:RNA dependent RNA polymerase P1 [Luteovirus sociomali]ATY36301.1 RNA dependent RNA polymerase P1 [Luteovirus sociomali]
MFFDELITASIKVVRDFIAYIYNNLKNVYKRFKMWLWELQGKFSQHDAFADMCYGYMDDVEEFEWELQTQLDNAETQMLLAEKHLQAMLKAPKITGWPTPTRPAGAIPAVPVKTRTLRELADEVRARQGIDTGGHATMDVPSPSAIPLPDLSDEDLRFILSDTIETDPEHVVVFPPGYEEKEPRVLELPSSPKEHIIQEPIATLGQAYTPEDIEKARAEFARARLDYTVCLEETLDAYEAEKGDGYFGRFFNTVAHRMAYIKKCKARRAKTDLLAHKISNRVRSAPSVAEFHSLCNVVEEPTGEYKNIHKDEGENLREEVMKVVRYIKPDKVREAQQYIRHYVRAKNNRLSADEVSSATINRYVQQFAEDNKLSLSSTHLLIRAALTMVPVITKEDMMTAMVIHGPAARKARSDLSTLEGGDF